MTLETFEHFRMGYIYKPDGKRVVKSDLKSGKACNQSEQGVSSASEDSVLNSRVLNQFGYSMFGSYFSNPYTYNMYNNCPIEVGLNLGGKLKWISNIFLNYDNISFLINIYY